MRKILGIIPVMKAVKMIRKKDCQTYLVNVSSTSPWEMVVEDIQIMREYSHVFPEDIIGVPPNGQVEFPIDKVLGAARVSKAPYRMTPMKLQELKIQIHELLDKEHLSERVALRCAMFYLPRRMMGPWESISTTKNSTRLLSRTSTL